MLNTSSYFVFPVTVINKAGEFVLNSYKAIIELEQITGNLLLGFLFISVSLMILLMNYPPMQIPLEKEEDVNTINKKRLLPISKVRNKPGENDIVLSPLLNPLHDNYNPYEYNGNFLDESDPIEVKANIYAWPNNFPMIGFNQPYYNQTGYLTELNRRTPVLYDQLTQRMYSWVPVSDVNVSLYTSNGRPIETRIGWPVQGARPDLGGVRVMKVYFLPGFLRIPFP